MESVKFSAVLLSWKRSHNLPIILARLKSIPQIDEVIVWNNNPQLTLSFPDVVVINSQQNFFCWARYAIALLARNENLWFQDDDLLIDQEQFDVLKQRYLRDPSRIYGSRGRNLAQGKYVGVDAFGEVDIVLGQTMMFHRRLLQQLFATVGELPSPMDDDIAFSLVQKLKPVAIDVDPVEDIGMTDEVSLSKMEGHFERRQVSTDRYLEFAARRERSSLQRRVEQLESELLVARAALSEVHSSFVVQLATHLKRIPGAASTFRLFKSWVVR